jgi:nucleoid DNA-binding protein
MEDTKNMAKATARVKSWSKSELIGRIAEQTELSRKEVGSVLGSLSEQVEKCLGRKGPGVFTLPGLVKIERRKVPARKARRNVPNPFKPGEMMDVPARPATTKIKVRALKNLKAMA